MVSAGWAPDVSPCSPEERRAALSVLYRRVPASLRGRLVEEALEESARGRIDLSGLWVARTRRRGVIGALLTQALAGRAAAVWAPEVDAVWGRAATAAELVRTALRGMRDRGFVLAQALLDESAPRQAAADLEAGGMPEVTELLYLELDTNCPVAVPAGAPKVDWAGYGPETEADLRAVLEATYAGSLDMPELDGLRSLDDVLTSHRAAGRFVPERWRVGHVRGEPAAACVLLLSEILDRDAWEVAYLGLTETARGRGLGRAALAHARELAEGHVPRIELAVDARNTPARRLYDAAGLRPFDRRSVHLAKLAELPRG
ncbi:MAG: GNAT family N-acetyltransferase [Isosphaeraceae bacterium]